MDMTVDQEAAWKRLWNGVSACCEREWRREIAGEMGVRMLRVYLNDILAATLRVSPDAALAAYEAIGDMATDVAFDMVAIVEAARDQHVTPEEDEPEQIEAKIAEIMERAFRKIRKPPADVYDAIINPVVALKSHDDESDLHRTIEVQAKAWRELQALVAAPATDYSHANIFQHCEGAMIHGRHNQEARPGRRYHRQAQRRPLRRGDLPRRRQAQVVLRED